MFVPAPDNHPTLPSYRTIISALSVGQILVWAIMYYGFSSFVLPMQRDMGWSQPDIMGAFTLGLMVGISVGDTTLGTAVANLGWDEVRFPGPVFIGDTLNILST